MRTHQARALVGWMDEREAVLTLARRREDEAPSPERLELVRKKHLVASVRLPSLGHLGIVKSLPSSLAEYAAGVERTRQGSALVAAGFQPALVDLRGVCAMAPLARVDLDLPDVDADDLAAIAWITLRKAGGVPADPDYDRELGAWILDDPELQVVGQFSRPGLGEFTVGFVVERPPSFIQVVRVRDRFVLTDGYDRAITLLARGIHDVPAFVRTHGAARDLRFTAGHLDRTVVLGRRPPLLPDFLDDDVSAGVSFPAATSLLMVRAVELVHHAPA